MTWIGIGLVLLMVFLLVSGQRSNKRTVAFYRRYYTQEELEQLADLGSTLAQQALGRQKKRGAP